MYSAYPEKPQTEFVASCTMDCLVILSESKTAGKALFHLWTNELRPAPSNQNYTIIFSFALYQAELFYNNQSEPMILTNQQQDSDQSELCEFENLICLKWDQLGI